MRDHVTNVIVAVSIVFALCFCCFRVTWCAAEQIKVTGKPVAAP